MQTIRRAHIWTVASLAALVLVGLAAAPAVAQDADGDGPTGDDQIVFTGRLVIEEGDSVDTALIFDGPATIAGEVRESVVVFNGDVEITGTVGKDVVVFNGSLDVRSGAEVGGNVVSQQTPTIEDGATVGGDVQDLPSGIEIEGLGFASRIAWWFAYSISALVLGLLVLLIAPGLDAAVARAVRDRAGAAFGFGAALFFLIPIVAGLLLVTIVGIPLGVFILLALALIYSIGYVVAAHAVGRLVVKPPGSRFLAFLAGFAILRVIALVPVLGGLTWFVASLFGLGVLALALRSTAVTVPPAPPPAPAMPPPAPTTT
jgi:hypothetical protein